MLIEDGGTKRFAERMLEAARVVPLEILRRELEVARGEATATWPRATGESAGAFYVLVRGGLAELGCRAPYALHVHGGDAWSRVEGYVESAIVRAAERIPAAIAEGGA